MKRYLKSFILPTIIAVFLCVVPNLIMSQGRPPRVTPGPPPNMPQLPTQAQGPGGPGFPPDDPDLPIDGGVSILVAAGVAYGAKKIRDERKKKLYKLQ